MITMQLKWLLLASALPFILPQALYVKRTTPRLPVAKARLSPILQHRRKLIHIGESTVAGVGVESLDQGLTSHLCSALNDRIEAPLDWCAHGVNGIRLKQLVATLPALPNDTELVFVSIGVNDVTGLTSIPQWKAQLDSLIQTLQGGFSGTICFSQVPPMSDFPALPRPLRFVLGHRAQMLDRVLERKCAEYDHVHFLKVPISVEPQDMASDGYHPSHIGYKKWADKMAEAYIKASGRTRLI